MNTPSIPAAATAPLPPSHVPTPRQAGGRWEPWPVGLAVFFALFVSSVMAFIAFALSQRMDLVRPDYYEDEIRYQVQLNRVRRTHQLGASAAMAPDPASRRVRVRVPAAHVASGLQGTVTLYRPSDARADRTLSLEPSAAGEQEVSLAGLGPGLWRVRARWQAGGLEYHLEDSVVLGR